MNNDFKGELLKLANQLNPGMEIESDWTLGGKYQTRIDLESKEDDIQIKIKESVDRMEIIFNEIFPEDSEVLIIIYDLGESDFLKTNNKYLYEQLPNVIYNQMFQEKMQLNSRIIDQETGLHERLNGKITIGKLKSDSIPVRNIFESIAKLDHMISPSTSLRISFFNINTEIGTLMYDDRGCYIWANEIEIHEEIQKKFVSWKME